MSFEMSTSVAATNQILTRDDIQKEISSHASRVQLILHVNSFYALTLLLKFKWDIGTLKESFHASRHLFDFLVSNKVCLKTLSVATIHQVCQICFAMEEDVKGLACRHMACGSCWKMYLKNKIKSGNPSIECFDCSLLICKDKLEIFIGNVELFTAYQKLIVNSYVNNVSNLTWCKKKCGKAVRRTGSNGVTCSCGAKFCFQCKRYPHTPASCDQMKLWERACEEHKELENKKSRKWIRKNTQSCPKCFAPIEKNGGCIHVQCWKCKYNFCWNCRRIWNYSEHGYMCGFPKLLIVRPNQQKIAPYLVPFKYHMLILNSTDDSPTLSECRRVLMYSYVYSYHQGLGNITKDFEQLQKKLKIELDLEKSQQNLKKCEQLRKTILDYCSSSQTRNEFGRRKRNKCCNTNFVVFLVLFFCCILAGLITAIVLFVV